MVEHHGSSPHKENKQACVTLVYCGIKKARNWINPENEAKRHKESCNWVLWIELKLVGLSREAQNSEDFINEEKFEDGKEKVAMMKLIKEYEKVKTVVTELKRRKQTNCWEIVYILITAK